MVLGYRIFKTNPHMYIYIYIEREKDLDIVAQVYLQVTYGCCKCN